MLKEGTYSSREVNFTKCGLWRATLWHVSESACVLVGIAAVMLSSVESFLPSSYPVSACRLWREKESDMTFVTRALGIRKHRTTSSVLQRCSGERTQGRGRTESEDRRSNSLPRGVASP